MKSIKEVYRIGRGPSSSHTIGPEKAAIIMMEKYPEADAFRVTLMGSLAKTGRGHRTDYVLEQTFGEIPCEIIWDMADRELPHPNTMEFVALKKGKELGREIVLSVGGGSIKILDGCKVGLTTCDNAQIEKDAVLSKKETDISNPNKEEEKTNEYSSVSMDVYAESTFDEIKAICKKENLTIPEYVYKNEPDIKPYLATVWAQMQSTIRKGIEEEGELPGGLHLIRRAKELYAIGARERDMARKEHFLVSAFAYASSEENAAGGKMVTAPTCGACGVLPAVLFYEHLLFGCSEKEIIDALAVAGIIGLIIRTNASVSGAEAGCQAEIGSACSMAAAAIGSLRGFSVEKMEASAEIAMEHCLGLTCDPVGGMVQIPCIERNAVGALRSYDAATLAEVVYENRKISFDMVVKTMYETGKDLSKCYRETAEGGLAKLYVNKP